MLLAIIIAGFLFMILMMALLFNPPEALIKKVFLRQSKPAATVPKDPEQASRK